MKKKKNFKALSAFLAVCMLLGCAPVAFADSNYGSVAAEYSATSVDLLGGTGSFATDADISAWRTDSTNFKTFNTTDGFKITSHSGNFAQCYAIYRNSGEVLQKYGINGTYTMSFEYKWNKASTNSNAPIYAEINFGKSKGDFEDQWYTSTQYVQVDPATEWTKKEVKFEKFTRNVEGIKDVPLSKADVNDIDLSKGAIRIGNYLYECGTLQFKNVKLTFTANDKPTASAYVGKTMPVYTTVYNNTSSTASGKVITALYSNNALCSAATADFSVAGNANKIVGADLKIPSNLDTTNYQIKSYIWDGFNNCEPLTGSFNPEENNLLTNSGFEIKDGSWVADWTTTTGAVKQVISGGYNSPTCILLPVVGTTTPSNEQIHLIYSREKFKEIASKYGNNAVYTITFDAMIPSTEEAAYENIQFNLILGKNKAEDKWCNDYTQTKTVHKGRGWQSFTMEYDMSTKTVVPDDFSGAKCSLFHSLSKTKVYLDNVKLTVTPKE